MTILDRKFYEIPKSEEKEFVSRLKKELFPKAQQKDYEILADWYSALNIGDNRISYSEATRKIRDQKLNFKNICSVFGGSVVGTDSDDHPREVWFHIKYKFLVEENLEMFRLAKRAYSTLRELKIKEREAQKNDRVTLEFLEDNLKSILGMDIEKAAVLLLDIDLLSCTSRPAKGDYGLKDISLCISLPTGKEFDEWYESTISAYKRILDENKEEKFKNRWFVKAFRKLIPNKTENIYSRLGIYTEQPIEKKNTGGLILLFVLALVAGGLTSYFFFANNIPVFGIFAALTGSFITKFVDKAF